MMRRVVTTMKVLDKDPTQRKSLFKTTCKVGGKVCKVLIDFGCTKNFVSLEMVEKLKLRKLPHPYPYKFSWLTQGQQAVVEEQTWVEFQIGSYKDRLLFDITKMDAFHLLFGRPWQYDLKAHHDGLRNTYSITKDGKVIELLPLIEEEMESKGKDTRVLIIEAKQFMKEIVEKGAACYALMPSPKVRRKEQFAEEKGGPKYIDPTVRHFLDKHQDIILDGIPRSLPLVRDISHCIDLILVSTLPNKVAYKLTPD